MNRNGRWLAFALKKAYENEPVGHYAHACVLVKGGRIKAVGVNNSKRGSIFNKVYGLKAFHAEADALSRFDPEEIKGATLYVAGVSEHGNICNSRPCKVCQQVIAQYPLRAVYYMDKGEVKQLEYSA